MSDMEANEVGNGCAVPRPGAEILTLDSLDKRTRSYRRYVAIRDAITSDLGGASALSEVQRQLASEIAFMAMQLEAMQAAAVQGEKVDLDEYGRMAGHVRRHGVALGLERTQLDVTPPDPREYLAARARGEVA